MDLAGRVVVVTARAEWAGDGIVVSTVYPAEVVPGQPPADH
jgi:hypothetical protein